MNKVSDLIINIDALNLDLQLKNIEKSVYESNDKVYFFENKWLELGVSIYLVEDFANYLQEVVKNFYEQLKVIEKLLVDKMSLTRHYDLTDRKYLKGEQL